MLVMHMHSVWTRQEPSCNSLEGQAACNRPMQPCASDSCEGQVTVLQFEVGFRSGI